MTPTLTDLSPLVAAPTGPTEATVTIITAECHPEDALITIGTPDTNAAAFVVDSALHAVPVGVPGELLLSGPRLAIGESAFH